MPFNTILEKVRETAFDQKEYKDPNQRHFFEFKAQDYSSKTEESKVAKKRKNPEPEDISKTVKEEVKLGWILGMDRDRLVQQPTNYSELIRNNCALKKLVYYRLKKASQDIAKG